jgi:hypothetical protein
MPPALYRGARIPLPPSACVLLPIPPVVTNAYIMGSRMCNSTDAAPRPAEYTGITETTRGHKQIGGTHDVQAHTPLHALHPGFTRLGRVWNGAQLGTLPERTLRCSSSRCATHAISWLRSRRSALEWGSTRHYCQKGNHHVQAHTPLHALHPGFTRLGRLRARAQLDATIRKDTPMIKLTLRYTRYILASLASVGFGFALN